MIKLPFKKFVVYVIAVFVLFLIPIYTIVLSTDTLKGGTEYYFKITAYDPSDMFRGNYLDISFEEVGVLKYSNYLDLKYNETCYVKIGVNDDGFAYFKDISKDKPTDTSEYYETTAYFSKYSGTGKYIISTPERYYMNENKSTSAENYLNENIKDAYVKVRVKNGKMVIVGLYVNDILIDTID